MTNEELDALVERLNYLGADSIGNYGMPICDKATAALQQLKQERDEYFELIGKNEKRWASELNERIYELAALRKKIEEAEPYGYEFMDDPAVMPYPGKGFCKGPNKPAAAINCVPLYTLEGVKE